MSEATKTVAIFGPGLMGGSLLLALRARHADWSLRVWGRRPDALDVLQQKQLADFCSTDAAAVAHGAKIAILCVPVDKLTDVARAAAPGVPTDCLVTDVGSVKERIVTELEEIFREHGNFIGRHPMCGAEATGLEAARGDLYEDAVCVVTPTPQTRPGAVVAATAFWEDLGSRVLSLSPAEHDHAAALSSHVPHAVAAALVELLLSGPEAARQLCAGGFRDTTRIAAGSAEIWEPILLYNRHAVARGLTDLAQALQALALALENNNAAQVSTFLESARRGRQSLTGEQA